MNNEMILGAFFGLIGFVLVGAGVYTFWKGSNIAKNWPTTSGTVTTSQINLSQGSRVRYSGWVVFGYQVGAQEYSASTVSTAELMQISSHGKAEAENKVARYPVGAVVTVFYDPADPKRAVLEHKGDFSLAILGLVFIGFAALFILL